MVSNNLETNVIVVLIYTTQAIRFSKSALGLVRLIPIDPIIPLYENAIGNLTDAFNAIAALPFIHPIDPVYPTDPVTPPLLDNALIIRLANKRTVQAIDRTDDAIRYMDTAISLNPDSDDLRSLVFIRGNLASARTALLAAIDFSV